MQTALEVWKDEMVWKDKMVWKKEMVVKEEKDDEVGIEEEVKDGREIGRRWSRRK